MEESALFDEMSRMNNELINARRQLIKLNEQLDDKTRFLSRILQLSPNFVYVYNIPECRLEFSNLNANHPLDLFQRMLPLDSARYRAHAVAFAESSISSPDGSCNRFEFRVADDEGRIRWFLCHETAFQLDADGRPSKLVGVAEDVSEHKAKEAALKRESALDQLTGLLNRRGFAEVVEARHGGRRRPRNPFALVFFDLDHFKDINDRHGHDQGDRALVAFSSILERAFRSSDHVARMGGDEFVVLAEQADGTVIMTLLTRLESQLEVWNAASGVPWKLRYSYGTAFYDPAAPLGFDTLLKRADEAMYEAKRARSLRESAAAP